MDESRESELISPKSPMRKRVRSRQSRLRSKNMESRPCCPMTVSSVITVSVLKNYDEEKPPIQTHMLVCAKRVCM